MPSPDYLIHEWTYSGTDNPAPGNEKVHLNFWLMNGNPPANQQEAEIIINSVIVTPAACTPPTVVTNVSTKLGTTTATLNGSANPNGCATSAWFEWGTTVGYGNETSHQNMGSETSSVDFSEDLTGLIPGQTYHYRAVAQNSSGTSYGVDQTFTTGCPKPTVVTNEARDVGTTTANLNGSGDPNGCATDAWFEWGTTTNYGNETSHLDIGSGTISVSFSVGLSGLTPSQTYHCRAVAQNSGGTSYGSDRIFTTSAVPFITVTSPNDGENWQLGSTEDITWTSNAGGNVKIELYKGSTYYKTITSSTPNDGFDSWTIPTDYDVYSSYRIKITSTSNSSIYDYSDSYFSLSAVPYIQVTSPNGGESWKVGSTQNITWNSSGTSGNVKIEYSSNGGSSWSTVVASTLDDGSHSWTIPNTPSSNCLVRITDTDGSPSDQSDGLFTISPVDTVNVWYVSTSGSDETGDGSENNPFRTIQKAINTASSYDTILVVEGTYYENITMNEGIHLIGAGAELTTINGGGTGTVCTAAPNTLIKGFTIIGSGTRADDAGIKGSGLTVITNNKILNNSAKGILSSTYSVIQNNVISGNGWGVYNYNEPGHTGTGNSALLINNTITNNTHVGIYNGSAVGPLPEAPTIINNIITNNSVGITAWNISPTILYNDVWDNESNYWIISDQTGINGNISADPVFADPTDVDYHLKNVSPCIGAGTASGAPTTDIEGNPRPNPSGSNPDMGAYENPLGTPGIISNLFPSHYDIAYLQVGDEYYIDRDFTITSIPSLFQESLWIKTENDDKNNSSERFITFNIFQDLHICVAYDSRATSVPNWLSSYFTKSSESIGVTDAADKLDLWWRYYSPSSNPVILGGNMAPSAEGAKSNYVVLISTKPVPVELSSFTASSQRGIVHLNWTTVNESNNFGFEVERSTDEVDFQKIGFVRGHNTTSTPQTYSFIDTNVLPGVYYYRLKQIDSDGSFDCSNIIEVEVKTIGVFALQQNYPNPFNCETVIKYQLTQKSRVTIKVFNLFGEEIRTLANKEEQPGYYTVLWDGKDDFGKGVASGVYIYRMEAYTDKQGNFVSAKKMLLLQ